MSFTLKADPYDADRHQMKLMLNDVVNKLNSKDFNGIMPYLDKNAVVTFYDARTAVGTSAINNYLAKMVTGPAPVLKSFVVSASEDTPAIVYSNKTAVGYGWTKNIFNFVTGEKMEVNGRWTVTLIKNGNNWHIVALHFSTNLFSNPLIMSVERKIIFFVIIALLIGLILGYLSRRIFSRR
jgi:hypothetical protein